jgi:4-amino-4-deoxychorismate lyase
VTAAPEIVTAVLGVGLVDPTPPVLRPDDAGVTRGDGCFEGCRLLVEANGQARVAKLDRHLARMARSAAALEIPFDVEAWVQLIGVGSAAWTRPGEAAMKLVLTRGPAGGRPTGFLTVTPIPADYPRQRRDGLRVVTLARGVASTVFADAPWLLGGVKTLSYAVNMAAQREAVRCGADDVVFVSTDGRVLEAPTSAVVWAEGRVLRTVQPGANGILASTTQDLLFERARQAGWRTELCEPYVEELHAADVVWLVGSVRGPADVVQLDGIPRTRLPHLNAEIRALCGF